MKGRIWLIGGTSESVSIAQQLATNQLPCTVTVTTSTAATLYPQSPLFRVVVGTLDLSGIASLLRTEAIVAVVDASHPYAVVISQGAIALASSHSLPYLRYERPNIVEQQQGVIELNNFHLLLTGDYLSRKRVLLTIGYQNLPLFQNWQKKATLFARILPSVNSLTGALNAGFTPDKIIAFRPPISATLEKALWQQWEISLVVTKASGQAGGEEIKRAVALELGIPLIVITRPQVIYPQQTANIQEVIEFCRQYLSA